MRITKLGVVSGATLLLTLALGACGGATQASKADVCDALKAVASAAADNETASDPAEALDALLASLEDFDDVAPSAIDDDATTLLDGTKRMVAQMSGKEEPNEDDLALLEDEQYQRAGDRVEAYAKKTCDVSIG